MTATPGVIKNPDMDVVRRRVLRSQYDWLVWKDADGVRYAARRSLFSIKQAMLAVGTGGKFLMYCARSVAPMSICWRQGLILRNNTRRGF